MRRRWTRWVCAGLIFGAVGCKGNRGQQADTGLPTPTGQPSMLSKAFGGHPKFPTAPNNPEPVVVKKRSKPGEPIKTETEVAFADTELEAAFQPDRPATERDQLIDSARQRYQRALDREPTNKNALIGLAKLYAKTGERDRAAATIQNALRAHPKDHEMAHQLAMTQARLGDWEGAVQSCNHAIAIDPENRTYQKTIGYCQAQLGRWDDAYTTMSRVMSEAEARYFLGRMLLDQDRIEDGRQQLALALKADPNHTAAHSTMAMLSGPAQNVPTPVVPAADGNAIQTVSYTESGMKP